MSRRALSVVAVILLVVAGVLVIGDRVAAHFAETATADQIAVNAPFDQKPKVRVHGIPFLTQAAQGRYDDVQITGGGLELGDIKGASLDAHLYGIHLGLADIFHRDVQRLPVDRVDGQVTVPYSELARISGVSGLSLAADTGGAVKVTLSASLPLLGTVQASGTAAVTVVGTNLQLKIVKLSAVGVSIPAAVLAELGQSVQVPIAIPALPYGLKITSVTAGGAGVSVRAAASNVVLAADGS